MSAPRFYDAATMEKIAEFFRGLEALQKKFEGDVGGQATAENPLYIYTMEIVIRHRDDWTVGKFSIDDFLYFEITDETYGEKAKS